MPGQQAALHLWIEPQCSHQSRCLFKVLKIGLWPLLAAKLSLSCSCHFLLARSPHRPTHASHQSLYCFPVLLHQLSFVNNNLKPVRALSRLLTGPSSNLLPGSCSCLHQDAVCTRTLSAPGHCLHQDTAAYAQQICNRCCRLVA